MYKHWAMRSPILYCMYKHPNTCRGHLCGAFGMCFWQHMVPVGMLQDIVRAEFLS